jgi:hypothetical protein
MRGKIFPLPFLVMVLVSATIFWASSLRNENSNFDFTNLMGLVLGLVFMILCLTYIFSIDIYINHEKIFYRYFLDKKTIYFSEITDVKEITSPMNGKTMIEITTADYSVTIAVSWFRNCKQLVELIRKTRLASA